MFASSLSTEIEQNTKVDVSKLSTNTKKEFTNIYTEIKKKNPKAELKTLDGYWKNILKAIKVKNSEKKDFTLEKKV